MVQVLLFTCSWTEAVSPVYPSSCYISLRDSSISNPTYDLFSLRGIDRKSRDIVMPASDLSSISECQWWRKIPSANHLAAIQDFFADSFRLLWPLQKQHTDIRGAQVSPEQPLLAFKSSNEIFTSKCWLRSLSYHSQHFSFTLQTPTSNFLLQWNITTCPSLKPFVYCSSCFCLLPAPNDIILLGKSIYSLALHTGEHNASLWAWSRLQRYKNSLCGESRELIDQRGKNMSNYTLIFKHQGKNARKVSLWELEVIAFYCLFPGSSQWPSVCVWCHLGKRA